MAVSRRKWIRPFLTTLLACLALATVIFTIISLRYFDQTERNLFGYKAFIVQSDSMAATDFTAGDLIFLRDIEISDLNEGDIISYQSKQAESRGDIITHKIRRQTLDEAGRIAFVTYGTSTDTDDSLLVYPEQIIGRYQGRVAKLGLFINFLRTIPGYILFIFLPFSILIIRESIRAFSLYKLYKQERSESIILKQKEAVDPDEYERMKRELETLRNKLDQDQDNRD